MEAMPPRIFIRNEWFSWDGRNYAVRLFQDDACFYLEVVDEELRPAIPEIAVEKEGCLEFKRFSNPNLWEDLVNRAKGQLRKTR